MAQTKGQLSADPDLASRDVTFPSMLSDDPRTTTALAAVRAPTAGAAASAASAAAQGLPAPGATAEGSAPPPATDKLPVIPLPAKNIVASSAVVNHPRDVLTQMAKRPRR